MLPTKFRFIWPSGFGGEDFQKSANQKQELPTVNYSAILATLQITLYVHSRNSS
jgi:hypothetical protein